MSELISFPSIEQFRNVIHQVKANAQYVGKDENGDSIYDPSKPLPTLKFYGTTKLHGTNAGIILDYETNEFSYQSRSRVLTLQQDNVGFMLYMKQHEDLIRKLCKEIISTTAFPQEFLFEHVYKIAIFGEWCGQGVAVSELPKMFVIFAVKVMLKDKSCWYGCDNIFLENEYAEARIFNNDEFYNVQMSIDFSRPELAQNKLVEITEAVEAECPVGKHFGVSGIGEGMVWRCVSPGWYSSKYWFKVKGEKHSVSKVKKLASIDVEAVENLHTFIDSVITENRLEQGLDNLVREQLKPFEMKSMGDFLRWCYNDVIKEHSDEIVANQIDPKKIGSAIANKARPWFVQKLNESVGA